MVSRCRPEPVKVNQGTPEQGKLIRHHQKVLRIVWFVYGGIALGTVLIAHGFGLDVSPVVRKVFGLGYVLGGGIALAVFSSFYSCCPVCKTEFSRQSGAGGSKYCEKCDTKFDI